MLDLGQKDNCILNETHTSRYIPTKASEMKRYTYTHYNHGEIRGGLVMQVSGSLVEVDILELSESP